MQPAVKKRPASRFGAARPRAATKTRQDTRLVDAWPGPGLLDSQQVVLSDVAKKAGGCNLRDLLQQRVKEKPHGEEHHLSKRMLNSATSFGDHDVPGVSGLPGAARGAEDTAFCNQADWLRQRLLEMIDTSLESFGLVELEQIHTFMLLVDFHRGRDWGVKLLPTSASSEPDDLTPVEDSDEDIEQLRQAYLQASTKARNAKEKAKAAIQDAGELQKALHTAWRAFTSAQEVVRKSKEPRS